MEWTQIEQCRIYSAIQGMDPRANWLFGPGIQDYLPNGENSLLSFVMVLHEELGLTFFKNMYRDMYREQIPFVVMNFDPEKLQVGQYFSALSVKKFFDRLAQGEGEFETLRNSPKEIRLGPSLPVSELSDWRLPPLEPLTPQPSDTVVTGIIDDGIAFAHERFRTTQHGSRVQCFWRQDPPNSSPSMLGHEICKKGPGGIDDLLNTSPTPGLIDEDEVYRRARLIDFTERLHSTAAQRTAHGTAMLDLAGGWDPASNRIDLPIIAVQLATATTLDTAGCTEMDPLVLAAVDYILSRADSLGGGFATLPVAINFSYGFMTALKDPTSPTVRALDQRIHERLGKLRIVLPAGNFHLWRCHAQVKFREVGQALELHLRVQPNDRAPSRIELWMPPADRQAPGSSRIELSVAAPGPGGVVQSLPLPEIPNSVVDLDDNGVTIASVSYVMYPPPIDRGCYLIYIQPTERLQPTAAAIAPSGVWTIRLRNLSLQNGAPIDACIKRKSSPPSYPLVGRQCYFDEACYQRLDRYGVEIEDDAHPDQAATPCHVQRARSINALGTGLETVVIGGFVRKSRLPTKYSSGGPVAPLATGELNCRPDAVAVSDDSKVHFGILAAGSRSGSRVAINGTSVAAPQIARWIASELAKGQPGDRAAVRNLAVLKDPRPSPQSCDYRLGWGRIDLLDLPRRYIP